MMELLLLHVRQLLLHGGECYISCCVVVAASPLLCIALIVSILGVLPSNTVTETLSKKYFQFSVHVTYNVTKSGSY